MASYVDSNLSKGEEVISRAHVSWLSYLISMIISAFFLVIGILALIGNAVADTNEHKSSSLPWLLILIGAFILGKAALTIATTELALTNKRVIAKFGFIRRTTVELRLEKVESIGVNQGILGRLLGYGSVVVRGTGGTGTPIPSIKQPLDFRRVVNNFIEDKEGEQR